MAGNGEEEDKGNGEGKETGCNSSFNTAISNSGTQVSEITKASPPNNIPFDYGGSSSFCSSAAMPSVPMGFQAATGQPEGQHALQNLVLHAETEILIDSIPEIVREWQAGTISTSFEGYPERMTDLDSTFASSSLTPYERAVANPIIFYDFLRTSLAQLGKNLLIPQFQGEPLDLHRIFVEVTSRGGILQLFKYGRLGEVCAALPQNIGDKNLYDIYVSLLYPCEAHLCNFPCESLLRPYHPLSAGARPMPVMLRGEPSLCHMQTILPAPNLPQLAIQNFTPPQWMLDTSPHQTHAQYLTGYPQRFTSPAARSLYPSWVRSQGQVQPVRPQRECQVVSLQKREVPASTHAFRRNRNPGVALSSRKWQASSSSGPSAMPTPEQRTLESSLTLQESQTVVSRQGITMTPLLAQQSSSARRLVPSQYLASTANKTAAQQQTIIPHVPAPISSVEQVSLQREVGEVATEAQAANVKRKKFPYLDWSLNATPGSASFPSAPEPNSSATIVSAQIVSQTTQALAAAQNSVMQTTDSLPTEDPAYSLDLNKWKIVTGESTESSDLPTTPSADKITVEEREAINEPSLVMKLNTEQQDNQMEASETRAVSKENSDDLEERKQKAEREVD